MILFHTHKDGTLHFWLKSVALLLFYPIFANIYKYEHCNLTTYYNFVKTWLKPYKLLF